MKKISVILPCKNEEQTIGICITKIQQVLKGKNYEIIVSDSSTDKSAEIAKKLGVLVIKHNKIGYGNAYLEGFKVARGNIIIMGDSDNTYDFLEIPKLLNEIKKCDLVLGRRKFIEKGAMPVMHRYIGSPILSFISRLFFGTKIKDINTGFRAIRKESLKKLNLKTTGMEFASEMIIQAIKNGLRINEIPIHYYKRKGESKLRTFHDGWRHLRFMLLYSPLFLFLIPGLIFFLAGFIFLIYLSFNSSNFYYSFLSSLSVILGYQLVIFSLFAKTYAINHLGDKPIFESFYRYVSIESASISGFLIILMGALFSFLSLLENKLNLIISFTFFIIGIQTIFSSFMLSILGIKKK
ncbi:Glycosyltransferase AglJ [uncultured archaeon]|nr:Glycosyltransferase AglJ [uncultured archaeon]